MKKKKIAAFLTALAVGLSGVVTADAMLSEDEQKAAYIEKAVREALSAEAQTEEAAESENETAMDNDTALDGTEAATMSVTEEADETEAETEAASEILEERGYEVFMTREDADTQLSEVERAELVNASDAQILISLHANEGDDSSERGASVQAPSYENAYITDTDTIKKSNALADIVLQTYCDETGLASKGLYNVDSRAQINWSNIPVIVLEMGFMSNEEDDTYMAEDTNQQKMAEGIADGIDLYFGRS